MWRVFSSISLLFFITNTVSVEQITITSSISSISPDTVAAATIVGSIHLVYVYSRRIVTI